MNIVSKKCVLYIQSMKTYSLSDFSCPRANCKFSKREKQIKTAYIYLCLYCTKKQTNSLGHIMFTEKLKKKWKKWHLRFHLDFIDTKSNQ